MRTTIVLALALVLGGIARGEKPLVLKGKPAPRWLSTAPGALPLVQDEAFGDTLVAGIERGGPRVLVWDAKRGFAAIPGPVRFEAIGVAGERLIGLAEDRKSLWIGERTDSGIGWSAGHVFKGEVRLDVSSAGVLATSGATLWLGDGTRFRKLERAAKDPVYGALILPSGALLVRSKAGVVVSKDRGKTWQATSVSPCRGELRRLGERVFLRQDDAGASYDGQVLASDLHTWVEIQEPSGALWQRVAGWHQAIFPSVLSLAGQRTPASRLIGPRVGDSGVRVLAAAEVACPTPRDPDDDGLCGYARGQRAEEKRSIILRAEREPCRDLQCWQTPDDELHEGPAFGLLAAAGAAPQIVHATAYDQPAQVVAVPAGCTPSYLASTRDVGLLICSSGALHFLAGSQPAAAEGTITVPAQPPRLLLLPDGTAMLVACGEDGLCQHWLRAPRPPGKGHWLPIEHQRGEAVRPAPGGKALIIDGTTLWLSNGSARKRLVQLAAGTSLEGVWLEGGVLHACGGSVPEKDDESYSRCSNRLIVGARGTLMPAAEATAPAR